MKNKVALIHKQAEEKRAMVEAKRAEEFLKAEETGVKYRATNTTPKKSFGCFWTLNYQMHNFLFFFFSETLHPYIFWVFLLCAGVVCKPPWNFWENARIVCIDIEFYII